MLLWVDLSVRKRSSSAAGNKKMRKGENDGNLKDMSSGVVVDDTGRILMASSKRIATIAMPQLGHINALTKPAYSHQLFNAAQTYCPYP
ncbi:hypothetical protein V6N12_067660 [Hibiscus sabdariffa]|uniref:Uncharacterized protein n=1 Tax=Hibiscus sabdariffa TaxID=183260 RepID=A0ABR2B7N2_9ROSI